MAPGSSSKAAKPAGALSNATPQPPQANSAPKVSPAANNSTPNAAPNSNGNAQFTALQLLPTTLGTSGNGAAPPAGLLQPEGGTEPEQPSGQPYRDGRIRNPVPSKLKGKTTAGSGRFSVMHMEIGGKEMPADRDLAAKRTSENTAKAAQKAFESGYQPHRKSNWVKVTEEPGDPSVPFTGTTPYNHALYGLKPATAISKERQSTVATTRPLVPEEVKEEQARLLTLLRTLQPLIVVDQLCKALAYFGGIPDAPPPKEGIFPESAEANGSGAVFVGWLAEIFPDLDAQGRPRPRRFVAPNPPTAPSTEKRGRGRPKGSKASKVRSDKGIKKGSKKNPPAVAVGASEAGQDNTWRDVDGPIVADENDDDDENGGGDEDGDGDASRARGRPKGARNRTKGGIADSIGQSPVPVSALFSLGKQGGGRGGRPKAVPRNRPAKNEAPPTTSSGNGADPLIAPEPQATVPRVATTQAAASTDPTQPEDDYSLAALQAFNDASSHDPQPQPSSFQPVNSIPAPSAPVPMAAKASTAKGNGKASARKRKRGAKDDETSAPLSPGSASAMPEPTGGMAQPALSNPVPAVHLIVPPAPAPLAMAAPKRQRKSRAKATTAAVDAPMAEQALTGAALETSHMPANPPAPTTPTALTASTPTQAAAPSADPQPYTTPNFEELQAEFDQQDKQSPPPACNALRVVQPTTQVQARSALSQPPAPQAQDRQTHTQPAARPQQPQQALFGVEQQRAVPRPRPQYQQQATARTASPRMGQVSTASPHLSVHSASPSIATTNAASPNLAQQRLPNSQPPTSHIQNQPSRNAHPYHQPHPAAASSYGQSNPLFTSPQSANQHFSVPQPQQQPNYSTAQPAAQQQPSYTNQQAQFPHQNPQTYPSHNQQSYPSSQHQYSSQRIQPQQYNTTSADTTPQTLPAASPQFGASTTSGYTSGDGNFRANPAAGMSFDSAAYGPNQGSHASRSTHLYANATAGSYGSSASQASSYSASPATRRTLPPTNAHHPSVQTVQNMPQHLSGYSDFQALGYNNSNHNDNNMISGLDTTTGSLHAAPYHIGGNSVSRPSTGSANFVINPSGSPYYGAARR